MTLAAGGTPFAVEVGEDGDGRLWIQLAGKRLAFDLGSERPKGGGLWSLVLGGRQYEVEIRLENRFIVAEVDGERYAFERHDASGPGASSRRQQASANVVAPMPGKVVKVLATVGDAVEENQGILLFEAMKMQNEIRSPVAGTLVGLEVREGQAVESRDRLFTVKAGPGSG